jgi:hypothetical protein
MTLDVEGIEGRPDPKPVRYSRYTLCAICTNGENDDKTQGANLEFSRDRPVYCSSD